MKKITAIISIFFFFLMIGTVQAKLLNFTGQNPKELYEDNDWTYNFWTAKTSAIFDQKTANWYVAVSPSQQNVYWSRWDWNLTVNQQGWQSITSGGANPTGYHAKLTDWNTTHVMLFYTNDTYGRYYRRLLINKEDITDTALYNDVDITRGAYMDVAEESSDYMMVYANSTTKPQKINFVDINNNIYNVLCPICDVGDGGLSDLNLVYVSSLQEYWFFARACEDESGVCARQGINDTTSKILMTRYKFDTTDNRFEPVGIYNYIQISSGYVLDLRSEQVGGNNPTLLSAGSMDVKKVGNFIYVWARESDGIINPSNHSTWIYIIKPSEYASSGKLYYGEEQHDLSDYDAVLDDKVFATGLSLAYNPILDDWYLFYQRYNGTVEPVGTATDGWHTYTLGSPQPCSCGDWYNVSSCGHPDYAPSGYQLQYRPCSPANCDVGERYVDCDEAVPTTGVEQKFDCCVCVDEWRKPDEEGMSRCSCSLEIPDTCTAGTITTNATWGSDIEITGWYASDVVDSDYNIILCNPPDNCFLDGFAPYSCEQTNVSQTWNYASYVPGDTAQADFGLTQAMGCRGQNVWWYWGWNKFRVKGQLCYQCDRQCGGWICTTRGFNDYKVQQEPDCDLNETSKELCSYGCKDGVCLSEIGAEKGIRTPSGNPFDWILGEAEYSLGSTATNVFAFAVSLGVGGYGIIITKKWQMGAIAVIGMVALFLGIGWISPVIGILWILSIALILMKGIFFKGD